MDTAMIISAIVLAIALLSGLIAWTIARRNRTASLREQFGPEYDAALRQFGDQHDAEAALAKRRDRVEGMAIRHFRPEEKELFEGRWHEIQARFVQDPGGALRDADALITDAMRTRGYPMDRFEVRAEDVSVGHSRVVRNYRAAHEIALKQERGQATTEDLRRAFVYYRALFEELLELQSIR